jgi:hypothetical protein
MIRLTQVFQSGDRKPRLVARDQIVNVDPDPRDAGRAIVQLRDGTKLFVAESFDDIAAKLGV